MRRSFYNTVCSTMLGFGIAMTVVLGLFSFLISSAYFEQFIFDRAHIEQNQERIAVRGAIRSYLLFDTALPTPMFTEREVLHMHDVRSIIERTKAFAVGILILLLLHVFIGTRSIQNWKLLISRSMVWLLGCMVLLFCIGVMWFDELFTLFHELLFKNDYWLLDPAQSALIRAYQPEFFETFAGYSFAIIVLAGIVIYASTRRRWQRSKTVVS